MPAGQVQMVWDWRRPNSSFDEPQNPHLCHVHLGGIHAQGVHHRFHGPLLRDVEVNIWNCLGWVFRFTRAIAVRRRCPPIPPPTGHRSRAWLYRPTLPWSPPHHHPGPAALQAAASGRWSKHSPPGDLLQPALERPNGGVIPETGHLFSHGKKGVLEPHPVLRRQQGPIFWQFHI